MAGISWLSCNRTRCDKDSVNSVESPPRASGEGCQSRAGMESPVELRSLPRRPRVDGFECSRTTPPVPASRAGHLGDFFVCDFSYRKLRTQFDSQLRADCQTHTPARMVARAYRARVKAQGEITRGEETTKAKEEPWSAR